MDLEEPTSMDGAQGVFPAISEVTNRSDEDHGVRSRVKFESGREEALDEVELDRKRLEIELSGDIAGTTSAKSKKMSASEHSLMLFKRKLRNRQSASKSRRKHQAMMRSVQQDIEELSRQYESVLRKCEEFKALNAQLNVENMTLHNDGVLLRTQLAQMM
uniref:BZIP domain-containing protein n=1 Tax=Rhodosorus marinus TaxID=101924 RepID=A0A7S2ZT52_9RHOD|mmetsp:Transcript_29607/g.114172  ORF Transcript_29607/g.114172 Transcript_29607/m.114172 type:complete len:160 (+) Transcript_29607:43-522(+)